MQFARDANGVEQAPLCLQAEEWDHLAGKPPRQAIALNVAGKARAKPKGKNHA